MRSCNSRPVRPISNPSSVCRRSVAPSSERACPGRRVRAGRGQRPEEADQRAHFRVRKFAERRHAAQWRPLAQESSQLRIVAALHSRQDRRRVFTPVSIGAVTNRAAALKRCAPLGRLSHGRTRKHQETAEIRMHMVEVQLYSFAVGRRLSRMTFCSSVCAPQRPGLRDSGLGREIPKNIEHQMRGVAGEDADAAVYVGTIARLEVTAPSSAFSDDTVGWTCPCGHSVKYPSTDGGTTVALNTYAFALTVSRSRRRRSRHPVAR